MSDKRTDAVAWRTNVVKGFSRLDGYMNVVNRIGTSKDSSEAYEFAPETQVPDLDLAAHYEGNGLFAKIIDAPAEKSATRDFDLGVSDENVTSLVTDALEDLGWITNAAQAVKWSRLFGGAIIVMLIDDGGRLEDPVNWDAIQGIDELVLFERAVVEPDYYSMYNYGQRYGLDRARTKYGQPEFFHVHSQYGSFTVHESRCLVFRNGTLPETTTQAEYRYWGLPEYIRIRRTLRETVTNHSIGTKMLEKSVQGVYKMKDLTEKLALEGGEDAVYKRMEVIDMVRGFLNSIIIDMDGEDYSFQTFQVSGFKEVIEASCNILSAVSNIPQAILFGSSPTGMDATGTSDLENWYNYLGQISDLQVKPNLQRLLDVLFRGWLNTGKLSEEPMYKLDFKPFWNLSESEQADLDLKKIQVQQAKAQVAQAYIDMQVLDPSEVRAGLAKSEALDVEELLVEDDEDDTFTDLEEALSGLTRQGERVEQRDRNVDRDIARFRNRRAACLADRGIDPQTILDKSARKGRMDGRKDDDWVTIKGTHVLVGEGGEVTGGPPNLKGKKYPSAKSQKKPTKGGESGGSSGSSSSSSKPKYGSVAEERQAVSQMSFEEKIDYAVQQGVLKSGSADFYKQHPDRYTQFAEKQAAKALDIRAEDERAISQHGTVQARGHLSDSQLPASVAGGSGGRRQVLQVMADTGLDREEAEQMRKAVKGFSGSDSSQVRESQQQGSPSSQAKAVEDYIASAPTWNGGRLYRGISVSPSEANKLIADAEAGKPFDQRGTSSWTSSSSVGKDYTSPGTTSSGKVKILYRTSGTSQGTSIQHLSEHPDEHEVIISKDAQWVATSVKKQGATYIIDCEEI